MAEELEIQISPTGEVTVRTIGIKGTRCLDAAEFIVRIVGERKSQQLTSEYYETEQHVERHQNIRNHQ